MKAKVIVMAVLATMAIASSVSAAVPSGYDEYVIVEKVVDWRRLNYEPGVYMPSVTRYEARHGGYEEDVANPVIIGGE